MNKTLPIQEWHQMALEGSAPPVCIPLMGWSMFPLIRYNSDMVTIVPVQEQLQIGDIVLFADKSRKNAYVVHRVCKIESERILTRGDNCSNPDGWLPKESIWGKVVLIERGRREIRPNAKKGMRWAKFWWRAGKAYRFGGKIKGSMLHKIRKLKERGAK